MQRSVFTSGGLCRDWQKRVLGDLGQEFLLRGFLRCDCQSTDPFKFGSQNPLLRSLFLCLLQGRHASRERGFGGWGLLYAVMQSKMSKFFFLFQWRENLEENFGTGLRLSPVKPGIA